MSVNVVESINVHVMDSPTTLEVKEQVASKSSKRIINTQTSKIPIFYKLHPERMNMSDKKQSRSTLFGKAN